MAIIITQRDKATGADIAKLNQLAGLINSDIKQPEDLIESWQITNANYINGVFEYAGGTLPDLDAGMNMYGYKATMPLKIGQQLTFSIPVFQGVFVVGVADDRNATSLYSASGDSVGMNSGPLNELYTGAESVLSILSDTEASLITTFVDGQRASILYEFASGELENKYWTVLLCSQSQVDLVHLTAKVENVT